MALTINWTTFCDTEIQRYALGKPWRDGDSVCATDGRILIMVDGEAFPLVGEPEGRVPKCEDVIAPIAGVTNWTAPAPLTECECCDSTGELNGTCEVCHGSGEHWCSQCQDSHECCSCDGDGNKFYGWCKECRPREFGKLIARKYMAEIASLPGVLIGATGDEFDKPLFFKFDGGRGAVMPIKPEDLAK